MSNSRALLRRATQLDAEAKEKLQLADTVAKAGEKKAAKEIRKSAAAIKKSAFKARKEANKLSKKAAQLRSKAKKLLKKANKIDPDGN